MSGRGGSNKQGVDCIVSGGSRRMEGRESRGQWEKIGPIKKYDMAYGKKNNTEPGITRFWIPVLDLLYYIRVDFRKHVFIHALHKTQRLIMTSITDIINKHE